MPKGVNLVLVGQLKVFSLGENGSEAGSPARQAEQRACKSSRTAMRACGRDSSSYGRYDARCATRRRISAAPGSNASCEIGEAASPCHGLAAWLQGTGSWHAGGLAWPGLAWPAGEIAPGVLLCLAWRLGQQADEFTPARLFAG